MDVKMPIKANSLNLTMVLSSPWKVRFKVKLSPLNWVESLNLVSHFELEKDSQKVKVRDSVYNKFKSKECLWLQWRKFKIMYFSEFCFMLEFNMHWSLSTYWFSNKSSSQDEQLWRFVIIFAICPLKIFQIQLFLLKLHKKSKAGENCFFCPHNQKRTHAHNAIYTVGWQTKWHGGLMSLRQDDKTGASPDVIVKCHTDTLHCHIILSHCDSTLSQYIVTVSQHFVTVSLYSVTPAHRHTTLLISRQRESK